MLHGGTREGALLQPTILTDVRADMRVMCEEIFAPVMSIVPFRSLDDAIAAGQLDAVRPRRRPLHARHHARADAARRLHVGVVHINEPSSSRVDLMPFCRRQGQRRRAARARSTRCAK